MTNEIALKQASGDWDISQAIASELKRPWNRKGRMWRSLGLVKGSSLPSWCNLWSCDIFLFLPVGKVLVSDLGCQKFRTQHVAISRLQFFFAKKFRCETWIVWGRRSWNLQFHQ